MRNTSPAMAIVENVHIQSSLAKMASYLLINYKVTFSLTAAYAHHMQHEVWIWIYTLDLFSR